MLPLLTVTVQLQETFCCFQKGRCKNGLFFFLLRQWQETSPKPPQATEILTIFCLLCISIQGRQHDGTTAARFGFHHQYLTHRCHPRTRRSTQTHTHTHMHAHMTSVSRIRLSELKPGRATWVVVTLYLITFSQAVLKCCSGSVNQSQNLSETYYRCTHQRSGLHADLHIRFAIHENESFAHESFCSRMCSVVKSSKRISPAKWGHLWEGKTFWLATTWQVSEGSDLL